MERRLIDANALIERIKYSFHNDERVRIDTVTETFLEECCSPTIDAVEVVRCKDCEHRGDPILCRMMVYDGKTQQLSDWTRDNGFCDFGVRREPDEE